ncbi:hypothetical protein ACI7RC_17950 [Brevibacillus sp. B_LB10_24]|uniref:hypothetical protein n=1 Tax=Brevibacillus sp. B_LB10_24 TaxID=3380645 RepID=UPI0038B9AFA5
MSTTELLLSTNLEGRVSRTLKSYFRSTNDVLLRESLQATGLTEEHVEEIMSLLDNNHTVSEIMDLMREKGAFQK